MIFSKVIHEGEKRWRQIEKMIRGNSAALRIYVTFLFSKYCLPSPVTSLNLVLPNFGIAVAAHQSVMDLEAGYGGQEI